MRRAIVYFRGMLAGDLVEPTRGEYIFRYNDDYFHNPAMPDICLTLTKKQQEYQSSTLFPFFYNMVSEGYSRKAQARLLGLSEKDLFGILLATAQYDVPGAVTLKPFIK